MKQVAHSGNGPAQLERLMYRSNNGKLSWFDVLPHGDQGRGRPQHTDNPDN